MELLTASDYMIIIDFLEENRNKAYISKYIVASYKREKALLRYLLFHNNLIAFGNKKNNKLTKLIILENNKSLLKNTYSLKVMACYLEKSDFKDVFLQLQSIYEELNYFKLFTDSKEFNQCEQELKKMGFYEEAILHLEDLTYYDFGVVYE